MKPERALFYFPRSTDDSAKRLVWSGGAGGAGGEGLAPSGEEQLAEPLLLTTNKPKIKLKTTQQLDVPPHSRFFKHVKPPETQGGRGGPGCYGQPPPRRNERKTGSRFVSLVDTSSEEEEKK